MFGVGVEVRELLFRGVFISVGLEASVREVLVFDYVYKRFIVL